MFSATWRPPEAAWKQEWWNVSWTLLKPNAERSCMAAEFVCVPHYKRPLFIFGTLWYVLKKKILAHAALNLVAPVLPLHVIIIFKHILNQPRCFLFVLICAAVSPCSKAGMERHHCNSFCLHFIERLCKWGQFIIYGTEVSVECKWCFPYHYHLFYIVYVW